jgi:integrase
MPIYKQPNTKNWLIEFKADGRRYRRSSGTPIKRKAELLEVKWRQEIHDGKHQLGASLPISTQEATDRYWETVILPKSSRQKSKNAEKYVLRLIVRKFGATTILGNIQASDISKWRDEMLLAGKAAGTINRYLAILRAILNRAQSDWNAISRLPKIRLLPLNNSLCRFLKEDEEERILKVCAPHIRNLIIFLVDTGARLSEALDLTWEHVELSEHQRSYARLIRTKNGRPRQIPLTSRLHHIFKAQHENSTNPDQPVFLYSCGNDPIGKPFRHPFGAWKTALRKAGVDQSFRIHDLRHTFASRLVSRGVPLYDVSKLLGHRSMNMTLRYAHLSPEAYNSAIEKLDAHSVAAR